MPSDVATVDGRLAATAAQRPDAPALVWQDRTATWAELDTRATAAAAALQDLGVGAGDRVAIVLGNVPAFVEAWFGVLRAGGVAVPAAPVLAPDEIRHVLEASGARVLVTTPDLAAAVADLRDGLPDLVHVVATGATGDTAADARWPTLLDAAEPGSLPAPTHGADDLATLVFTSGTTGRPRGAMLTHGNLTANQDQTLAVRSRLTPEDRVLVVLPLFHVYGLNVGLGPCVAAGSTVVLQERFDPLATAQLLVDEAVTVVLAAPQMLVAWSQDPPVAAFATVRLCVSGAAALPPAVGRAFAAATGVDVREGYGLTEAGPSVASNAIDEEPRFGSVGRALPDVELRLVERGEEVEVGEVGEVWVRGPNVFRGYWGDDEATAAALVDGWLRTGDVGILDEGGWLRLVDRSTDLIIVSGFNVYPREVERVLSQHPAVAAVAVTGQPHPLTGESVLAHVVRVEGSDPTEDELVEHCRIGLARYKCPAAVRFVTELPLPVTGKVRRTELRLA